MFIGQDGFVWWLGVVEDIADPALLGRARVRIFGYHAPYQQFEENLSSDVNRTPVSELPWAPTVLPTNMPDAYGKPRLGDWVLGFFLDGKEAQEPMIIGYVPGFAVDRASSFGKNFADTRNFSHVYATNGPFVGSGQTYSDLLNRFSYKTPAGHKIEMIDNVSVSQSREVSLVHGNGMYHRMTTDLYGNSTVRLGHPSGSYIEMKPNGGIEIAAHYPGNVQNIQIGAPPPGGGGDCFTEDSFVTMADGSLKKISEIKVGEYVMNRNQTRINRVKFIERVVDTTWDSLYSPNENMKPFATINHPLYIDCKLSCVFPRNTELLYPWLGDMNKIESYLIEPTKGEIVYNLWVDGDGTYTVNGYGTTSIMMDGGLLRIAYERGYLSHEEVMDLVLEFTTDTNNLQLGAYVVNGLVARLNIDALFRFFAWVSRKPKTNLLRKTVVGIMRYASVIGRIIYRR